MGNQNWVVSLSLPTTKKSTLPNSRLEDYFPLIMANSQGACKFHVPPKMADLVNLMDGTLW